MHAPEPEPIARFQALYAEAQVAQPKDPNACVLASCDDKGRPSARVVLLKGVDALGFVVFTNHHSRKGKELLQNRFAALCFHWPSLDTQVRVEGSVTVVTDAESDAYFATRARASQLGAWTSQQSQPLESRAALEAEFARQDAKYQNQPVPRPPHWGGFRLTPDRMEFWKAGNNRLHHRECYLREAAGWDKTLLYP